MIGILYESDEWSDWKLGRELEAALAENALADAVSAEDSPHEGAAPDASQDTPHESTMPDAAWRHVRMINMEGTDAVEQALACDMLVSRVFASAAFRGHEQAHRAMEKIIALADSKGIPLINPGRAHRFEIDKRLATETLRAAGITAPAIIAWGTPGELDGTPGGLGNLHDIASDRQPQLTPEHWLYPCIIKPNCGGRTTHTAVLRSVADARAFLSAAPGLVFIVEPYIEAVGPFLTRIEVMDGRIALVVKRSVAASGLSSYHEGSTYELYPDCPAVVTGAVLEAARILDIQFGSFDVIEATEGNFIIDANSVSNVSEDCTDLFGLDLMAAYAQALASRYRKLRATQVPSASSAPSGPNTPSRPSRGDIVSLMSRTLGAANRYLVELMAREGLAGIVTSHGDILMQLFAHDAMSMAALAEAIGKDPSTVTALVRKLANAGYVEKAPNPRDRRVCEVRLTDAGRALEPAMDRVSLTLITTLTNSVPAADLAATCRTMKAIQKNISAADDSESKREPDSQPAAETRGDHR